MHTRTINFLTATLFACGLGAAAHAQVGSGWTSTSVSYNTQVSSGCSISNGNTFVIDGGSGRAERRYTTLTSGSRQFQGTFKINSLGGDRVSVFQTFSESLGPKQMGAVKKPGSLYEVHGGATLASYSIGSTMRINTTISSSWTVDVYVNGSKKGTTTGVNDAYNKIGSYATASGAGPCSTTWTSIAFWRK